MDVSRISSGVVFVSMANGEQIEVQFASRDTTLMLKEKLKDRVPSAPCFLKLIHGVSILQDDWVLAEKGIADGATLTLVLVALPSGTFVLGRGIEPAGSNTSASVLAEFQRDGGFSISIDETEVTSDYEDMDYDPYKNSAAWHHHYVGRVHCGEEGALAVALSSCTRKGIFTSAEPQRLEAETCENEAQIRLQLPFAAGGCNEGTAGLRWVTLQRTGQGPLLSTERVVATSDFTTSDHTETAIKAGQRGIVVSIHPWGAIVKFDGDEGSKSVEADQLPLQRETEAVANAEELPPNLGRREAPQGAKVAAKQKGKNCSVM